MNAAPSSDLIRKIRALLATAESLAESGHEEAAGAYIAKAHGLQQKHSIDAALLEGGGMRRQAVISRTWVMPGRYGRRKIDLAHVVARRTGCTGYFQRGADGSGDGAYRFVVFGFPQDVEWAETLTYSLCHQADAALAAASDGRAAWEHGRSFATSFLAGFTSVVGSRLREAAARAEEEAAEAAAQAGRATSVAVVLAGKTARVEAEMRASVPHLRTARSGGGTSMSGYDRGRHAGRRASLARGSVRGDGRRPLGR